MFRSNNALLMPPCLRFCWLCTAGHPNPESSTGSPLMKAPGSRHIILAEAKSTMAILGRRGPAHCQTGVDLRGPANYPDYELRFNCPTDDRESCRGKQRNRISLFSAGLAGACCMARHQLLHGSAPRPAKAALYSRRVPERVGRTKKSSAQRHVWLSTTGAKPRSKFSQPPRWAT